MMQIRHTGYVVLALLVLAALWLAPAMAQMDDDDDDASPAEVEALVRVSADTVAVAHDRILGNNILGGEPFGDDGGGLWDPQGAPCAGDIVGCYKPAPYRLLSETMPGILRFPGGRLTRSYVWQQGVGPALDRDFLFGTDEFLFLARRLGAEPVITLSIYDPDTGDFANEDVIAAAVAWLRYVNEESPYGPVTYWEIDADTWENTTSPFNPDIQFKRVPPEAYAEAFIQLSQALKAVDSTIKIGAGSYENKNIQDTYRLLQYFAASGEASDYWPDFLMMNFFRPNFNKSRCDVYGIDLDAKLRSIMAAAFAASTELTGRIEDVANVIETIFGDTKPVDILVNEFNTQLLFAETMTNYTGLDDPPACPFRNLSHSLGAAIYNADVMLTLIRHADSIMGSAIWDFMDTDPEDDGFYGAAYLYEGQAVARPDELALKMLGSDYRMGEVYDAEVVSATFDNDATGRTPAYRSINLAADENYIRVRVIRYREPVENTPDCGTGNIYNPDPNSYIRGIYRVDDFSLVKDSVDPELATNLMTNGDFAQDLGVGWTHNPDPTGVTTSRECVGEECYLQLEFAVEDDNNPQYLGQMMQTVAVEPGARYSLSFRYNLENLKVKTQNLMCDPSWELTSVPGAYNNSFWVQYGSTPAPATIVDTDCFSGTQCVQVPIVDNPEYYHIRQRYYLVNSEFPELADPASYHVRGYIKTTGLDAAVTIEAQAKNSSDQLVQANDSYGVFGDSDWQLQDYRMQLSNRPGVAFINVHLRRKQGRKENGVASFDNVRMYRDEYYYAPHVVVDICKDADCADKRTMESSGDLGNRDWTQENLSGTPLISALVGRNGEDYNILLINKDLDRTVGATVDLSALGIAGERVVYISRLTGDALDANNELGEFAPELGVTLSNGEYYEDYNGETVVVNLPPHSLTGIKILDPSIVGDDDWPPDDDTDDDIDDDDATPDDDTTPEDDDTDVDDDDSIDQNDDDDDDDCCGCGC